MRRFGKWLGRLLVVLALGLAAFFIFAPAWVEKSRNQVVQEAPWPVSDKARALHESLLIGDWHADSLLWNRDLSRRGGYGQVDIPRLQEGNVAIQVFTAVTKSPRGLNYEHNDPDAFDNITLLAFGQLWPPRTWTSLLERALYQADKLRRVEEASPDALKVVRSRAALEEVLIRRQQGENVVAGLLGLEGAHPLEGRLENLDLLEAAGYRVVGLQHFFDNELGGTLHSRENNGLTEFGRQVVAEVEARGMVLDLAHSSTAVAREVLDITDMPVIVSHTGIFGKCPTRRNYPDELMKRIAATGGVIGIGYWKEAVCDDSPAGIAAMIKAAIELLGEDAVSLGSDFDGSVKTTFDTSQLAALTQAMLDAGLSEAQIRKVAGENMLRVLRARLK